VDGYVLGSAISSIPLAGRDITKYIQASLRKRGAAAPPPALLDAARRIKERHCYTCADPAKEAAKYRADPGKYSRVYDGEDAATRDHFSVDVGEERFMAAEVLFDPALAGAPTLPGLPDMVDRSIQQCPIDARRALYGNIVLSGGTTMFKDFGRRLQRDVQKKVDDRVAASVAAAGAAASSGGLGRGSTVRVSVVSHPMQRYAVWCGGSVLGMSPAFPGAVVTRADYQEHGPSRVRNNPVFCSEF
jgi:actin-related protein 3